MGETTVQSTALPRFLLLYAALYAAFGVVSPFLPALVNARGVPAAQLGFPVVTEQKCTLSRPVCWTPL